LINLSLEEGQDYRELPKIIAINIINFDFLNTANFHTIFRLREDKEHEIILTDSLEIHFINMVKWRSMVNKNYTPAPLDMWLAWLDKMKKPELAEEAIMRDNRIAAAEACLEQLKNDKELMYIIEMREKARRDWSSGINYAHDEGRAEGEIETRIETARNALAEGLSHEKIHKITGLSIEEIAKL
jgi:predicted transposase/invertase (TIGR01784 family)